MMPNTPLRVDEIQRRPILVIEGAPYEMFIVDSDRVTYPHLFHSQANVIYVFFKRELRRMNANQYQSLISIFFGPGADIWKCAQPVDASVGPEINENDLSAQSRRCEGRRIEPLVRALKRGQLRLASCLASRKPVEERNPY